MNASIEMVGIALATAVEVTARRLTAGPLRPSWSFRAEFYRTMVRNLTERSKVRGDHWLRALQGALPSILPAALRSARFSPVVAGGVPCEWVLPPGVDVDASPPSRAIVYIHGGGYVIGSVEASREIAARLALGVGVPVLVPGYRLAPEHRFPAAHEDCLAAVAWLESRGTDVGRVALAGDSAGGALAVATLLARRDAGQRLPVAAALLCPWVEPLADGGSVVANEPYDFGDRTLLVGWIRQYASDEQIRDPRLTLLGADLRGLPPLVVQAGEAEVLFDQIRGFAERARAAGVAVQLETYPEMFHDFQVAASLVPEGEAAVESLLRFLAQHLPA
jgi:acetyl esterase/lipase